MVAMILLQWALCNPHANCDHIHAFYVDLNTIRPGNVELGNVYTLFLRPSHNTKTHWPGEKMGDQLKKKQCDTLGSKKEGQ